MIRSTNPLLLAASLLAASPLAFSADCESLARLNLPHTAVTVAQLVPAGTFTPPSATPIPDLPAFCRIAATLSPTTDSAIRIELWMPASGWNSRFEGTGNGGFAGGLAWGVLAGELRRGFAVVNTDMGMHPPAGSDAAAFVGHPEKWADWGYRSTHEMTVVAKQFVKAYYQAAPAHSYFSGCSTGGEQALMEAQRYPDDYDGILGGAAANNRTGVHTSVLWTYAVTQGQPADQIPPAKLALLASAVLNACDAVDGLKDGLITDPRRCHFDPAVLQCKAAEEDHCLTPAQVQTARRVYAGPVNPRTRQQIYPGVPRGTELDWARFAPATLKPGHVPYEALFQWVFGADWNWRTFDFDHNYATVVEKLGPVLNAVNPDLSAFRSRGHKLIVYHGWADWLVPPGEAINYREAVLARRRQELGAKVTGAAVQQDVDQFYRLFMIPGMAHCSGGPGLTGFSGMDPLVKWVEEGIAPDSVVVSGKPAGLPVHRPVCPYPSVAQYRGSGPVDQAESFTCASPRRQ
ncbi:MAG TPA: tannase/feruloyl esterase family alpha/beta hydrolase [Bryobacteraceae bacterium]|jgi:feruloyl esterase